MFLNYTVMCSQPANAEGKSGKSSLFFHMVLLVLGWLKKMLINDSTCKSHATIRETLSTAHNFLVIPLILSCRLKHSIWWKCQLLRDPDKQENAPEFPGAFYVHLFFRVFPSWEPLMDHETSAIQVFLCFSLMRFPLIGQADQRLA